MKKAIKRIAFAAAALTLGLAFAGCTQTPPPVTGGGGEASIWQDNMNRDDDFLEDDNRRPSREPYVDNTPEDTGDPVPYRFEAEAAKIRGVTSGEDHFCTAKSTEFSPDFSGNITLCNLGTATLQFTFTSDKAVRSAIRIRMANQYGKNTGGMLAAYANITVNDNPVVDLSAAFDITSGVVASGCSASYFKMVTLETKISLAEGKNLLSITPATANYLNLDYIEIHTSAVLEDKTESTVTDPSSFVDVVKEPTETAAGQIGFVCHNKTEDGNEVVCKNDNARKRTLPALTSEIYKFRELESGTQYVVEMYGGEAVIVSTVTYMLTLQGATLADGTASGRFAPGERPTIKYSVPEGQVFSHWEDAEGNNLGSAFVMPEKDITVKPVFVSAENTVTVTLQGATLDGKNTVAALAGNSIDLSAAEFENQPEDTVVRYWYNVADVTEYYEDFREFTVPDADITLAPAFDKEVYANRDGSTTGKLATFPYYGYAEIGGGNTQPADGYIRNYDDKSGENGRNAYWGYVGTGESREMGAIYYWKGKDGAALANGFYFTPLSPYKVEDKTNYTIATTIQNQGDKEITLKLYQINGGSAPKTGVASETFTLQPDEVKTVILAFSYENNNIMTTVELLTDGITELHIGMYQYISTALYNLTLEGATFADGSTTSGKFVYGASPELKYTVPEGKAFSHWEDSEGNNLGERFVMPEKDITIKPVFVTVEKTVTVTLQGATLDGENTVTALVGSGIDLSAAEFENQPEGTVVRYWYNVDDVTDIYEDFREFTVPDADITLAPAFDKEVYANRDGSTTGKLAIFPYYGYAEMSTTGNQPADGYVRLIENSGVKGRDAYWGYVGTGESREMGAIYYWKGKDGAALANGFYFTPLSPYKVEKSTNYTIATTIQNQGDKEITLKLYQINSSGTPKTGVVSEEFTLQPDEVKTVILAFSYENNNIMTTVELLTDGITELHIGMYQYISTELYNLTLEGATFADDSTSGKFVAGYKPEIKYTAPERKVFSHWEDAEGNNLGEQFVMPGKDITIKPVFEWANSVTVTLQGATIDGETVINTYAGSELDLSGAVITDMPEGKILKGWFDVTDRMKRYTSSFTVPEEAVTLAPVFDAAPISNDNNFVGKITQTGNVYRENKGHSVIGKSRTGAIDSGNGYYEYGSIYRYEGGTSAAPEDKMAVGSYFVTQEMNGQGLKQGDLDSAHAVTTTVENFGSEDVTLRFALIKSSGDPNSQYGEKTVTIKAGESVTFTFDITYMHASIMLNVMVKEHDVSEVYIGVYQYISDAVT